MFIVQPKNWFHTFIVLWHSIKCRKLHLHHKKSKKKQKKGKKNRTKTSEFCSWTRIIDCRTTQHHHGRNERGGGDWYWFGHNVQASGAHTCNAFSFDFAANTNVVVVSECGKTMRSLSLQTQWGIEQLPRGSRTLNQSDWWEKLPKTKLYVCAHLTYECWSTGIDAPHVFCNRARTSLPGRALAHPSFADSQPQKHYLWLKENDWKEVWLHAHAQPPLSHVCMLLPPLHVLFFPLVLTLPFPPHKDLVTLQLRKIEDCGLSQLVWEAGRKEEEKREGQRGKREEKRGKMMVYPPSIRIQQNQKWEFWRLNFSLLTSLFFLLFSANLEWCWCASGAQRGNNGCHSRGTISSCMCT